MSRLGGWRSVAARWAAVACCAWLETGCAEHSDEPVAADAAQSSAPAAVEVMPVDRAAYDALVAKQRGRVVVVDFWATWCLPCMQQLPHTIELAERHSDKDLAVATVSMDDADARPRVEQLLVERGAGKVINLVTQDGGGPQAMEDFEISGGALPHYKLYDRTGKLRRTFEVDPAAEKQFTTQDIDAAVEELLGER